ncbi:hypothetical protein OSG_eHP14_00095 [environmental Halophage eHP-14]|nr:hypothetical protein OSG_eHP14_00095 [environmental Halophage eHP-14]
MLDDDFRFRASKELVEEVEAVSKRTGIDKSAVCRRLLRLGLEDIEQIGDEALLAGAAKSDDNEQPAD